MIPVFANTKKIPLTRGQIARVDSDDYDSLASRKWSAIHPRNKWYAARGIGNRRNKTAKVILMHRQIMNPRAGQEVDHINGNGLDNRRHNLRVVTHQQNHFNRGKHASNKSGFRGVSWDRERKKWFVCIRTGGKTKGLGRFKTLGEAVEVWNKAAATLMCGFAKPNQI